MTLEKIASELAALRSDLSGVKSDLGGVKSDIADLKGDVKALDTKVDSVDGKMRVGFEESHRLIKMSFESVQILDEKIDRRFNETERQHANHKTLIEAAIGSLGRDVRSPAGPASRRRR